jgi:hypothetical protein
MRRQFLSIGIGGAVGTSSPFRYRALCGNYRYKHEPESGTIAVVVIVIQGDIVWPGPRMIFLQQ